MHDLENITSEHFNVLEKKNISLKSICRRFWNFFLPKHGELCFHYDQIADFYRHCCVDSTGEVAYNRKGMFKTLK